MRISVKWYEVAEFSETITLAQPAIDVMTADGIDMNDPQEVFEFLYDNGDLEDFEPVDFSSPKLDYLVINAES